MLRDFLKDTYKNVRGSARTDALHDAILHELKTEYPKYNDDDYEWVFEHNLSGDAYGGKFKVDILGKNKTTGKWVAILCKCNNSNIGKNIYNMANTTLGESMRLLDGENEFEKVLFVSVFPRMAPLFKTDGTIRGWDNITNYKNRINTTDSLTKYFDGVVEEVNLFYDIVDWENKKDKTDFTNGIEVANLTKIEVKY
jgi:hypothetical protein